VLGFSQVPPSILLTLRPASKTQDRFTLPAVNGEIIPGVASFFYSEHVNVELR
jgi:hypothetical protein